jgi:hypothetical protein
MRVRVRAWAGDDLHYQAGGICGDENGGEARSSNRIIIIIIIIT